MVVPQPDIDLPESVDGLVDENPVAEAVPKLVQRRSDSIGPTNARFDLVPDREFRPITVTRLGGTLPWQTDSIQLDCGETVTETNGDLNIRLVYECVCTKSQFEQLQQMRENPQAVRLVSAVYNGPVSFDQLKFDRVPDANGAILRSGETNEPIYEVQLQSKEREDSGTDIDTPGVPND